jgi:hypothetical protein
MMSSMGVNRRKAEMEIAIAIREADKAISGMTLGQVCAAGVVSLEVACYQCSRRGRYRLTRLIDRHGAGKVLPALKDMLTAECPKRGGSGFYEQCGAYFPRVICLPPK